MLFFQPATDIWSSVRETLAESTPADPDGKDSEFSYSSSTVTVASKTGLIPPKPMMIPGLAEKKHV